MHYDQYKVNDFLEDQYFVQWVIRPDGTSDLFWRNWLKQHPDKRLVVEEAIAFIRSIGYAHTHHLEKAEYTQILNRLQEAHRHRHKAGSRFAPFIYSGIAACVLLLLMVLIFRYDGQVPDEKISLKTVSTENGQKKTIDLPDGSQVILNSGSVLRFPEEFEKGQREVELKGEAFFRVSKDPERPFVIHSGELTTRVLGTSFNIRSYADDEKILVSVATGRVRIEDHQGHIETLLPSDMGVFHKSEMAIEKLKCDVDALTDWTRGILIFKDESLPEIFDRLEKWYGVKIKIEGKVDLEGKYSGRYDRKPLDRVLEGISYTSQFNYKVLNKTVTIYEK